MYRIVFYFIAAAVLITAIIIGSSQADEDQPWRYEFHVPAKADVHMTVNFWRVPFKTATRDDIDSTLVYTLFDGVVDRDCLLTFVDQPQFWSRNRSVDTAVVLPFPAGIESGKYILEVITPDTSYSKPMLLLK